jgi:anti-sigma B factor antagonist
MTGLDVDTRMVRGDDEQFAISLEFDNVIFMIELYGELDLAGAPRLQRVIARAEETSAVTIIVDLSGLQFIDSSGIRVLLTESKRSTADSNRVRFLRGTDQVERTLALCGLDQRLPFLD